MNSRLHTKSRKKKLGKEVHKLATKKRGRPKLLSEKVMEKTITLIKALRLKGAPVNVNVINAVTNGIIMANDRTLLIEHGVISVSANNGEEAS